MKNFEANLNYQFKNPSLLKKALTHPSALPPGQGIDFERLEFLGDRVLGLVMARWLFEKFPKESEGNLAARFANLVRKETLLKVASTIKLESVMVMKHETSSSQKKRLETLLADGCEALIGALYLDDDLEVAQVFIHHFWEPFLEENLPPPQDPKSALQEWVQSQGKKHPQYELISSSGPAHAPDFIVEVSVEGLTSARGKGSSKRLAEKDAAQEMLKVIAHD
ncbi:MAG: ribonuclease III [Alphaproteobacteria bacterium]|nr:ribonuclease III [Alphaproteobacteria bacterium]